MDKKIGIVTITERENFGNRLQNYALQSVLKNNLSKVDTIQNYAQYRYRNTKPFILAKRIISKSFCIQRLNSECMRQSSFRIFNNQYIEYSKLYSTLFYIPKNIDKKYDFFIAGSDQIWNPNFIFNFDFNFLRFADRKKRISYAASFGVDEIPERKIAKFKEYLDGFDYISVREYEGAKIIKELTGRNVQVHLDPTLLLSAEDWLSIARKPSYISEGENYILVYFLGDKGEMAKCLKNMRSENTNLKNCRVIDIQDADIPEIYSSAPDNFLWLIANASAVLTDSYHGTIFSLLFNTPFLTNQRKGTDYSMNSRIKSLYKILDLDIQNGAITYPEMVLKQEVLNKERQKAIDYLKDVLLTHET